LDTCSSHVIMFFHLLKSVTHVPMKKFILSINFGMACIWKLSSPSGGGGVLFWSNIMVPAKLVSSIKISSCHSNLGFSHCLTFIWFLRNWNHTK
jgi:hypothetical protein